MVEHPRVIISSAIYTLPGYYKDIIDACLRQGIFPLIQEQNFISEAQAIRNATALVSEANIYLGIFANYTNYGVAVDSLDVIIREYEQAISLGIPRLIFLMHEDYSVAASTTELQIPPSIYNRLRSALIICESFASDELLRAYFVDARISPWRNKLPTIAHNREGRVDTVIAYLLARHNNAQENALVLLLRVLSERLDPTEDLHGTLVSLAKELEAIVTPIQSNPPITTDVSTYAKFETFKAQIRESEDVYVFRSLEDLRSQIINNLSEFRAYSIPSPYTVSVVPVRPAPYIAHPYTLLQTHELVGRQTELDLLHNWISKPDTEIYHASVLSIVAIGGMGKSALTWTWFNDVVSSYNTSMNGYMWWSFYGNDASFERFTICALAYITGQPKESFQKLLPPERIEQLLRALEQHPFLLVLDGLERILVAYAYDEFDHPSKDQSWLRQTIDPQAEIFLRKVIETKTSRILISSRLCPNALLNRITGKPIEGNHLLALGGLNDKDAFSLWRTFGVSGTPERLLPIFQTVDNHPLLIQSLAREVARYRYAPGNFEKWQQDHPDFNPGQLPLIQRQSHILKFALRGLEDKAFKVLQFIGALCMPANFETLVAIAVGKNKLFTDDSLLDRALTELEARGLLGWNRAINCYNLHPVVRAVTWETLKADDKKVIYAALCLYFMRIPLTPWQSISHIEELTNAIELYNALIGIMDYDNAYDLFRDYLHPALYRLHNTQQYITLLERLFPNGVDLLPPLKRLQDQAWALNALGQTYDVSGRPAQAVQLHQRQIPLREATGDKKNISFALCNLSNALRLAGKLQASEAAAKRAVSISLQRRDQFVTSAGLKLQSLTLLDCGRVDEADALLHQALEIDIANGYSQSKIATYIYLSQKELLSQNYEVAQSLIDQAWQLVIDSSNANVSWRFNRGFIQIARLRGMIALNLKDLETAEIQLNDALLRARTENLIEEELRTLLGLAQLQKQQGNLKKQREFLEDLWELVKRGPYPTFTADAYNLLADIECNIANASSAVQAATTAYCLAWCDGPPYSYHWGLETAKDHLVTLKVIEMNLNDIPKRPEALIVEMNPLPKAPKIHCVFCHGVINPGGHAVICRDKQHPHHWECWQYNGGRCSMYGCRESQYEAFDVTKQAPQENDAITLNEPDDMSLDVFSFLKKLLRD